VSDWCISNSQDEKLNDKTLCSGYQALFSHRKGSVNVELSHSSMQYAHWMVFSAEHSRPAICDGQVVYCCCDLCRRLLHVASYRCILHVAILHVVRPQWTTHSRRRCLSLLRTNRSATTCTKACATPSGRCSTRPTRTARITSKLTEQPLSSQCDCMPWHNVQHKPNMRWWGRQL
jgi:hypothetical protein